MAVWSEVNYSNLPADLRFEAEYFQPKYLELMKRLSAIECDAVVDLSYRIRSGPFGSNLLKTNYVESGVVVLRPFNIKEATVEDENLVYITQNDLEVLGLSLYRPGDLAFARVGDIRCGIIPDYGCPVTISPNIIIAQIDQKKVDPYFLSVFMNTSPGLMQMERAMKVVAQPTITVDTVKSLLVPRVPYQAQAQIGNLLKTSLQKRRDSHALYAEAESLLLRELGLDALDLAPQTTYTAMFSAAQGANRLDAEYFQPKYRRAMRVISASGKRLRDVAKLSRRRFKPESGKPFKYIEIGDVTSNGQAESQTIMGEEAPSRAQWIVNSGDIITSTVRPIRRLSALIQLEQTGNVCSSGFIVLQPQTIPSEILLVYLRLPIICEVFDLHTTASMYPAISTVDLMSIPIAVPGKIASEQIASRVQEAFQAHHDAYCLLDEAKRQVEALILGKG